jgi:nucleotide-binding universal stress UspA family protein
MHGSPCAVAIAPRGYADQPDRGVSEIVVGYDASPESKLALGVAYELARASGAPVKLIAAAEPPTVVYGKSGGMTYGWGALKETLEERLRTQLEQARGAAPNDVTVETEFVSGQAAESLAEAANAPGSILLLGSRSYGPVRRVLAGSVSRELANSAPAPLIVHPRGIHEEPKAAPTTKAATTA